MTPPVFPTEQHASAAEAIAAAFGADEQVDTILITNSCARGRATPESDLDLVLLTRSGATPEDVKALEARWSTFVAVDEAVQAYRRIGPNAYLHVDVITGHYEPTAWDEGGGPDAFEIEIGNHIAYSAPLTSPGPAYAAFRAHWLPYYDEELRARRLAMVRDACLYDLDKVPFFHKRDLPFQAFDRLYKAHQEFLQALFISRRMYPLAYNKWIHEQVVEWLGLEPLFPALVHTLSIPDIAGPALIDRAEAVRGLVRDFLLS
jgi:predicted nucleotidyltransferase